MAVSSFPAPHLVGRRFTIAILTHADLGLDTGPTIARIAHEHWVPAGHRIVVHQGVGPPPPADLAILHVGYTVVAEPYLALAALYPRTINAGVADTSKRRVCSDLLSADDPYDGPVIVKTDLNHAGKPENRRRRREAGVLTKAWLDLERYLPMRWSGRLKRNKYLKLKRKRDVPSWIWDTPGLVVQPFHMERRGELYALHQWYFLGECGVVSTLLSPRSRVKWSNSVERLPLHDEVPEALHRRRAELKFDYGKFDFVIVDGEPKLFDANSTPNEGRVFPSVPRVFDVCKILAPGLDSFLR